jgi:hypothetical protein
MQSENLMMVLIDTVPVTASQSSERCNSPQLTQLLGPISCTGRRVQTMNPNLGQLVHLM